MTKTNSNSKFILKDQYLQMIIILSSLYGDNYLTKAHGSQLDSQANMIVVGRHCHILSYSNITAEVNAFTT